MKRNKLCPAFFVLAALVFTGCMNDDADKHHFDNTLYISSEPVYNDLYISDEATEATRAISVRLAIPAEREVTVRLETRASMAAEYNMIYNDAASALPESNYEIPETVARIKAGDVLGDELVVNFKNINQLDRTQHYVLPVTIAEATNIGVLQSDRTVYFVFKGGTLISVVANITKMYFPVNWNVPVRNLKTITVEALLRSSDWSGGRDGSLSSVFGIETDFLIRLGDSDRPANQLQFVVGGAKWPAPNAVKGLPVNEWVHIALVFNSENHDLIYYMNGEQVAYDKGATGTVSLDALKGCYVGRSYDNGRWLPGEISELRVWNIQRTAEQIKNNPYYVDPQTPGLLAYWKFNEGEGNVVHDATGNGTTLTGTVTPKWVRVELPPAQ